MILLFICTWLLFNKDCWAQESKIFSSIPGALVSSHEQKFQVHEFSTLSEMISLGVHWSGPIKKSSSYEDSEDYLNRLIFPNAIIGLKSFLFNDLPVGVRCPNSLLAKNFNYIHYLFRLQTLGLLYEAMNSYLENADSLGIKTASCNFKWQKIIEGCNPSSKEMNKFKARGKIFFDQRGKRTVRIFFNSEKNSWVSTFKKNYKQRQLKSLDNSHSYNDSQVTMTRLYAWCDQNKMECREINFSVLSKAFEDICTRDLKLFEQVCSEKDELYGLSRVPIMTDLLTNANTFSLIDDENKGRECLQRFVQELSIKEVKIPYLEELFPAVAYDIALEVKRETGVRYLQGRLFLVGALKEFDDKGLDTFLFIRPTPSPSPLPLVMASRPSTPATSKIVVKKKLPLEIPTPVPAIPSPVIVNVPVLVPTPTPIPLSTFELAVEKSNELYAAKEPNVYPVKLDMAKFKLDFKFTTEMKETFSKTAAVYRTRAAIEEMCKVDKLGTSTHPMSLTFIKFLIDEGDHQGIYNVIQVLGHNFYVVNDLEDRKRSIPILLKNNPQDGNWEISVYSLLSNQEERQMIRCH